jgi:F0F1-type ATP synthase alpha subunit
VEKNDIRRWEKAYITYLREKQQDLLADIRNTKQIDDGIKARLEAALKEYKTAKA